MHISQYTTHQMNIAEIRNNYRLITVLEYRNIAIRRRVFRTSRLSVMALYSGVATE